MYPNLAAGLVVSSINQLWRADITYIRLREEFVYLAVVLDAFSRRAIGWALDATLEARLAVAALEMAFARRRPRPDWCIIPIRGCSMPATQAQQVVFPHPPLHSFAIDRQAATAQLRRNAPTAIGGPLQRHPLHLVA